MKTLVIAEKPSVARDIARVLKANERRQGYIENGQYVITWAVGHLVSICNPEEQDSGWKAWELENLPMLPTEGLKQKASEKTLDQFKVIDSLLKSSDVSDIICATDAAREGVHIFQRIYRESDCSKPYKYLWAADMTDEGLRRAFSNLLDAAAKQGVSEAGFARSEADWLVGMNMTRLYSVKCNELVSLGRVQTPVLKLIVDRTNEIKNFEPEPYWMVEGNFGEEPFKATWFASPYESTNSKIDSKDEASAVLARCQGQTANVDSVDSKPGQSKPPLPFDLTTIQREANSKYGFSAQDTLSICQALYEKHKVLTYPRTDSRYLTEALFNDIEKHIKSAAANYGDLADMARARIQTEKSFPCVNDKKVTDHHAIIPTGNAAKKDELSDKEWKVYDMVTRRFLAAFLAPARFKSTTMWICINEDRFKTSGKVFVDSGWLVAEPWRSTEDKPLPDLAQGDPVDVNGVDLLEKKTKPPKQFTEASLLGAMETAGKQVEDEDLADALKERGLGTPATRAGIIETLIKRQYIERQKKNLVATKKGLQIIETVDQLNPDLASPEMTGHWEKLLRDIEEGTYTYKDFMRRIHKFVSTNVDKGKQGTMSYKGSGLGSGKREVVGSCPLCGKDVAENKKSYGCTGYPDCKFGIWKEIAKGKISSAAAKQLLAKGQTSRETKFISKSGKPFKACLKLDEEGKTTFVFQEHKAKKK